MIKYDNCKDCCSKCEHAGKDREFICPGGVSCKVLESGLEERYKAVLKRLPASILLNLPEELKEVLKKTADLKRKVELLEAIADILNK